MPFLENIPPLPLKDSTEYTIIPQQSTQTLVLMFQSRRSSSFNVSSPHHMMCNQTFPHIYVYTFPHLPPSGNPAKPDMTGGVGLGGGAYRLSWTTISYEDIQEYKLLHRKIPVQQHLFYRQFKQIDRNKTRQMLTINRTKEWDEYFFAHILIPLSASPNCDY